MRSTDWSLKNFLPIIIIVIALAACVVSSFAVTMIVIDRQKASDTPVNAAAAVETFVVNRLIIPPTPGFTPYESRTPIRRSFSTAINDGTQAPTSTISTMTSRPTYTLTARVTFTDPPPKNTNVPKNTPVIMPTRRSDPPGATALCKDGTYSFSQSHSGTCLGHGGVLRWYK